MCLLSLGFYTSSIDYTKHTDILWVLESHDVILKLGTKTKAPGHLIICSRYQIDSLFRALFIY